MPQMNPALLRAILMQAGGQAPSAATTDPDDLLGQLVDRRDRFAQSPDPLAPGAAPTAAPPAAPMAQPPGYVDQAQTAIADDPVNLPQGGPLGAAVGSELSRPGEALAGQNLSQPGLREMLKLYLQGIQRQGFN